MALMVGIIGLAACVGGGNGVTPAARGVFEDSFDGSVQDISEQITIGISMYLLVDDLNAPDPTLSSLRGKEELTVILAGMNEIWSQANIRLELAALDTIMVDADVLRQVAEGDVRAFFDRLGESIPFTETGLISGFYAKSIGGANGLTPRGSRWFIVMDEPSVFDHRVSSHEVGHILGLRHTLNDRGRLLFPGTYGMSLIPAEVTLTRYLAMELLKTQR
jgi:hypothetical protein